MLIAKCNYLFILVVKVPFFIRSKGGHFVLRIKDMDLERSTRQSEEAMLQDLSWLGLEWDEGTLAIIFQVFAI